MANKDVARRFIEAFNSGDLDTLGDLVAPGWRTHDPAAADAGTGPDGARELMRQYRDAFPDINLRIEQQVEDGDFVATRWTGTGTHEGELMGIPATGKSATVTGIVIDRIENGRIAETWENWDTFGLLTQLGVIPAPAAV